MIIFLLLSTVFVKNSNSQIHDSLLFGYWIQVDYAYHEAKYKVSYSDTVLDGGLHFEKEKVNFLDGIYWSELLYTRKDYKNADFKSKAKSNFNNITNYFIKDSTVYIEEKYENRFVPVVIKLLNKDSLILYNESTHYEIVYVSKDYSDLSRIKFNYIEFYHGPCFGNCPVFKVKIDKKRNFVYEGISSVDNIGIYDGVLPKRYFQDIWEKLRLAKIPGLKNEYRFFITDASTLNLKISFDDNMIKEIESYAGAGTTELKWIINCFGNFEKKINLR